MKIVNWIVIVLVLSYGSLEAGKERDWLSLEDWTNQELPGSHELKSIQMDELDDYEVAVTYALDGGRFGDQLTNYLKALWISWKYDTSLIYRPFDYSDQLALSDIHTTIFSEEIIQSFDAKLEYFSFLELEKSEKMFQYLDKMPNHKSGKKKQLIWNIGLLTPFIEEHFCEKMDDKGFRTLVQKIIKPKNELKLLSLPKDYRTIAIHVRTGIGFDWEMNIRNMPTKFAPDTFYLSCLKKAAERFKEEPLYVYIFTDHPDPLTIQEKYSKEIADWGLENEIILDCRKEGNSHTQNILEDLFSMMKFDCIIHSDSSFSRLAAIIAAPLLQFRPSHWGEIRKDEEGNPILDKQGNKVVDPLMIERTAKGESIHLSQLAPIEDSMLFLTKCTN